MKIVWCLVLLQFPHIEVISVYDSKAECKQYQSKKLKCYRVALNDRYEINERTDDNRPLQK